MQLQLTCHHCQPISDIRAALETTTSWQPAYQRQMEIPDLDFSGLIHFGKDSLPRPCLRPSPVRPAATPESMENRKPVALLPITTLQTRGWQLSLFFVNDTEHRTLALCPIISNWLGHALTATVGASTWLDTCVLVDM